MSPGAIIAALDQYRIKRWGTADLETISELEGYSAGLAGELRRAPKAHVLELKWLQAYDEGARDRAGSVA